MKRVIDQCMCGEDEQPLYLRNWSIVYFDGNPLPGVTQVVRCHSCGSQWKTRDMDAHDLSAMGKIAFEGQEDFECSADFKREREESIRLLQQAINRLKYPRRNANGGSMQLGGIYWRLMHVAASLEQYLSDYEGKEHAAKLIYTHFYKLGMSPLGMLITKGRVGFDLEMKLGSVLALMNSDIFLVSDLLSKTSDELLRMPMMDSKKIQDIETALDKHGLKLNRCPK